MHITTPRNQSASQPMPTWRHNRSNRFHVRRRVAQQSFQSTQRRVAHDRSKYARCGVECDGTKLRGSSIERRLKHTAWPAVPSSDIKQPRDNKAAINRRQTNRRSDERVRVKQEIGPPQWTREEAPPQQTKGIVPPNAQHARKQARRAQN